MTVSEATTLSGMILGFSSRDLKGVAIPHNDTLVIHSTISNYKVARVFVDVESSANVLFYTTLERMGIKVENL